MNRPQSLPATEDVNPRSRGIDELDALGILRVIHAEDRFAWEAVGRALEPLARLVDAWVDRYGRGGRLIYVGAGTSGRLGVLDAAECPPTFGLDPGRVVAIIAGGDRAFVRAVEGAEDSMDDGARAIEDARACDRDIVCGIAASGTTPFVRAALRKAKSLGATSALLHSNSRLARENLEEVDHPILLDVGPEVVAGSTRMKCGTATKMAVQMLTTAAMIRAGKVYDNLMVDVVPTNRKLERRACLLVSRLARVDEGRALELLAAADWRVKVAVVLELAKTDAREAKRLLDENDGHLRRALRAAGVAEDALPGSRAVD